jgi:homoserine O-acetyltransferase/O-succinyltransferase
MSEFIPPATRFINLPDGFAMRLGGQLDGARVAYESVGRLNEARDNVVLILTGMSPDAHVAAHPGNPSPGWWEKMVGSGKPVDTDRWHVICMNPLGSCKGSTGPATFWFRPWG